MSRPTLFIRWQPLWWAWLVILTQASLPLAAIPKRNPTYRPAPVIWQEDRRGLCVTAWVNDAGPFTFVLDTGAGLTLLSPRTAARASVRETGRTLRLQGTGAGAGHIHRLVTAQTLALGQRNNRLPRVGRLVVVETLPPDVDGILDPTEVFGDTGYELDFPNRTLAPLIPQRTLGGTVVRWLPEAGGKRPFVALNGREPALIDTGSGFGLAIPAAKAAAFGIQPEVPVAARRLRDITGRTLEVTRVSPVSVRLEPLYLERIPTDLLHGTAPATPLLLGRDALRPFRIAFDLRQRRLIFFLPPPPPLVGRD
ncbi:retropepsin-like aspartic protease [Chloracidobacterium aggregatum]|uniref:Retropepsin-like domain-containing protein n=1 Tax=Chloracidobacterium sp. N TaxID=2821540 RepID=A0ABX8B3Z8_9BACT|nr:retropepsin-like aspartic protease [Chloracidobacterium aggregatum]QUV85418.1 retropepsin-like domain-containing protein [Chloracidobacterium sp. 2]QUV88179.1 retropepsin-like domain-containing protein [Chloracidobacterium sp. S]QUV94286.1 retropepsin-like domain-containing protein [Chloracidobacterium sp. N]QUV97487.1 retropepsin-like domain-containing protein [Chloracidobacterium sp. E]